MPEPATRGRASWRQQALLSLIHSASSLLWLFMLLTSYLPDPAGAFVIAPPWANSAVNPCSATSWQLLFWPADKKCYQIFEQGPCPRSQELAFNPINKRAECRCPKDLLYWPATDRCYPEYGKGPCELNQYLEKKPKTDRVQCRTMERCKNGWIFWPSEAKCYELYSQGPCHKGDLLIMNPLTAEPYCGCDPLLLRQYYFPSVKLCYEHFTRGPCESGLLYAYNHTSESTHCMCSPKLVNFHHPTARCFQFGTKGPCSKGQIFQFNEMTGKGECSCKDNYVLWPENGECYKAFTPGPCRTREFIIPDIAQGQVGVCVQNPCPRAHLYFPDSDSQDAVKCHKVGSRGPCPLGELVVFEKYSGKSYRGECGCSPGYNQNFWAETDACYEWYTQGPCDDSFLFRYDKKKDATECVCDDAEGYVFWNETKSCYRVYTQGPCPENAWLIPGEDGNKEEVFCECRDGFTFDPTSYSCLRTDLGFLNRPYARLRPTWPSFDSAVQLPYRGQQQERKPEIEWSKGIFVNPGHTGIAKRIDVERPKEPDYAWLAAQWDRDAEWSAKTPPVALPRVARARVFSHGERGGRVTGRPVTRVTALTTRQDSATTPRPQALRGVPRGDTSRPRVYGRRPTSKDSAQFTQHVHLRRTSNPRISRPKLKGTSSAVASKGILTPKDVRVSPKSERARVTRPQIDRRGRQIMRRAFLTRKKGQ